MKNMAGRKRHSAEDIVRELRRADELAAAGKTNEEIAADLQVSPATLYNWRRTYGGMDVDAAKELRELREQNTRLLNIVERSITGERLVEELEWAFAAAGGPPVVLRMDNGPEMISQALQRFCKNKVGLSYIPPGRGPAKCARNPQGDGVRRTGLSE